MTPEMTPEGFEPPTRRFEAGRSGSVELRGRDAKLDIKQAALPAVRKANVAPVGVEPTLNGF